MKKYIYILVALIVVSGVVWVFSAPSKPGKYDDFAMCVKDSGAVFYGAFWCPHCQNQKAKFGKSAKLLPYIECSTPDGRGQTQICKDAGVTSYPTWDFVVGSTTERINTTIELPKIAELTGCALPQ